MVGVQAIRLPAELRFLLAGLTTAEVTDDQQWILAQMRKEGLTIINMLWRILGSEPDVLDAYQSTICRLAARGERGLGPNRAGYFYRTAMNTAIETLRARRRRRQHWPAVRDLQQQRSSRNESNGLDQREVLERMRQAITKLPIHLRNVIVLRDLAELPYTQVARIVGIRVGTARLYRRQAIVRLAELIGQEAS